MHTGVHQLALHTTHAFCRRRCGSLNVDNLSRPRLSTIFPAFVFRDQGHNEVQPRTYRLNVERGLCKQARECVSVLTVARIASVDSLAAIL